MLLVVLAPLVAHADDEAEVRRARAVLDQEPPVDAVVRTALEYFRVQPETMDGLRAAARIRGVLPLIAAGYAYDDDRLARGETSTGDMTNNFRADEDTNQKRNAVTVGAIWDLRQLVFNPAEVQVYGLIGVQRDMMLEVTRVYFLRRQLYMRMLLKPPDDPIAREALQLRIDEFTSLLDVLTGGWFSKANASRTPNK